MTKVEGCWASGLDDCSGPLTAEHLAAVSLWQPDTPKANRRSRLRHQVHYRGKSPYVASGMQSVKELRAHVLCEGHNNETTHADQEAGRFATAVGDFYTEVRRRQEEGRVAWPPKEFTIDGLLFERYMMKFAINNLVGLGLPIGGPDAEPDRPTLELAQMVFGRLPVLKPTGLWRCTPPKQQVTLVGGLPAIQYGMIPVKSGQDLTYYGASLFIVRGMPMAVVLDQVPLTPGFTGDTPGWADADAAPGLEHITDRKTNVSIRFRWPRT